MLQQYPNEIEKRSQRIKGLLNLRRIVQIALLVGVLLGFLPSGFHPLLIAFIFLVISIYGIGSILLAWTTYRLSDYDAPEIVGTLLDVWSTLNPYSRTIHPHRAAIEKALIRLLPRVESTGAPDFLAAHGKQMERLLTSDVTYLLSSQQEQTIQLKIAAILALQRIGNAQQIPLLQRMTRNTDDSRVREAAQECLSYLSR